MQLLLKSFPTFALLKYCLKKQLWKDGWCWNIRSLKDGTGVNNKRIHM